MIRLLPLALVFALASCGSCSKKEPAPPPKPVPADDAEPARAPVNVDRLKNARLKNIKGMDKLRSKMKMDDKQLPASTCAESFPGEASAKLVTSQQEVPAAPTIAPRADRRIPDRIIVTWAPETTIEQANTLLKQHKLRVGAFRGQTPFATLCSDGLGADKKLDALAVELAKSKLIKTAQPALGGTAN
jgi:hypothetical protein